MRAAARGALVLLLLATGAAAEEGSLYVGGGSLDTKPQSKLWHHDGGWWAVFHDGSTGYYIHRLDGTTAVRGALVGTRSTPKPDVLWNGEHLFVLMAHPWDAQLSKFTYAGGAWTRVTGFPVGIPLGDGWEHANLAQDAGGRLWIAQEHDGAIRVLWSTSADHATWDAAGVLLETGVDAHDMAAVAAFDGRIGVMWSDQQRGRFAFRAHRDADPPTSWGGIEIASSAALIEDDHINLAVTSDQRLLAATKSGLNEINLFVRHPVTGWSGPYLVAQEGTRPLALYDRTNDDVYVFYTDTAASPWKIVYREAPVSDVSAITLDAPGDVLAGPNAFNDVTSTKQAVDGASGIVVAAKAGTTAHWSLVPLDDTPPPPAPPPSPPPSPSTITADVNFQPAAAAPVAGYLVDSGARYDSTRGYGWTTLLSTVEREADPDQRRDTFVQIDNAVAPASWEYALPNGAYRVTLVAGDPAWSAIHKVAVEGTVVIDSVATTREFVTVTDHLANVQDGRLTVTLGGAVGGKKSKICYLRLRSELPADTPPVVSAAAEPASGDAPLAVSFLGDATDDRGIATWRWDFGDGTTSTEQHPAHTFLVPGSYVVRVTVTDTGGLTDEAAVTVEVASPNEPPVVSASADVAGGVAPLTVSFTGTATDDRGVASWSWDFGDGATSSALSPSHTYASPGTYESRFAATDTNGLSSSATVTIVVVPPNQPPTALPSASVTSGSIPLVVSFTGAASDDGTISAWSWDFGDGTGSTAQSPSHTYASAGTYAVRLTVTDDDGATGSATLTITARQPTPGDVLARINFQPAAAPTVAGYLVDAGLRFDAARGYGWSRAVAVEDKDAMADQLRDSYAYVKNDDPTASWDYALPDGRYYVTIVVGSPDWNGIHKVALEGTVVIDSVATGWGEFAEVVDREVLVSDGRLTITAGGAVGGKKTKVCYVVIRRSS